MLAWIMLLIAGLGGLFLALEWGVAADAAPAGTAIALALLGALTSLYVVASPARGEGSSLSQSLVAYALAIIGAVAGALPLLGSWGLLPVVPAAHTVKVRDVAPNGGLGPVAVRIRKSDDGRFIAQALLNGHSVQAVIDTGASAVMLRASDADAAGIDVSTLTFDTAITTANGTTYAAPVRLRSLAIGALQIGDVEAFVAKPGSLNESLLGISFLRRLTSYDLAGDFLTLRN